MVSVISSLYFLLVEAVAALNFADWLRSFDVSNMCRCMSRCILLCYFYIGLSVFSDAALVEIKVVPKYIEKGKTEFLTVNCTYPAVRSHAAADLVSLALYRTTHKTQSGFQKIVDFNITRNDRHGEVKERRIDSDIIGSIDNEGVSYLMLRKINPTVKDAGEYTCVAYLISVHGEPSSENKSTTVTIPWYMRQLEELDVQIQKLKQENIILGESNRAKTQAIKELQTRLGP